MEQLRFIADLEGKTIAQVGREALALRIEKFLGQRKAFQQQAESILIARRNRRSATNAESNQ
jgi:hypothetical protein